MAQAARLKTGLNWGRLKTGTWSTHVPKAWLKGGDPKPHQHAQQHGKPGIASNNRSASHARYRYDATRLQDAFKFYIYIYIYIYNNSPALLRVMLVPHLSGASLVWADKLVSDR